MSPLRDMSKCIQEGSPTSWTLRKEVGLQQISVETGYGPTPNLCLRWKSWSFARLRSPFPGKSGADTPLTHDWVAKRRLEAKFCHMIMLFYLSLWSHQGKGLTGQGASSLFWSLCSAPTGSLCMTLAWNVPRRMGTLTSTSASLSVNFPS